MSISSVLVTGAAGLIGSTVVRLLVDEKKKVIACDNFSIGRWHEQKENIIWIEGDICDPVLYIKFDENRIDAVVHCAAHPGGLSIQAPSESVHVNALGSMRIFEWCARNKRPVIYLSSSIVYGDQAEIPIAEDANLNPGTIYGVCKVACENFLQVLNNAYGLQWLVLRLFSTYGAGHTPNIYQGVINVFLTQLMSGNRVLVKGSLNRVRDLIYVEDAARAIMTCLFNEKTRNCIINVGTGIPTTVGGIIHNLCQILNRDTDAIEIIEEPSTVGDTFYNVADIKRMVNLTGFQPAFTVSQGLEHMLTLSRNAKG
jgi:UDP-glucose 4-epimerase